MRKIVVLTDTRAEYGILKNTLKAIKKSQKLELYIVVTGAHLSEKYGYTVKEIEEDGFEVYERIPVEPENNENIRVSVEMGNLLLRFTRTLERIKPDILLLFGDRYEMLAAATAAVGMHIAIAHISGGESTEGAMDEQIRHAITKMTHIHFPGATEYADNIKKMGEESWRVFDVGDPGIENIKKTKQMSREELKESLGLEVDSKTLLITYHPVTLERHLLEYQIDNLIMVLKQYTGNQIITYPNSDDGSELIIEKLQRYAEGRKNVCLIQSLGITRYLSVMSYCGAVVGNSSSAIVEAPFLKVPVVNIGNRQAGRMMAESIISCGYSSEEIENAIIRALSDEFKEVVKQSKSLYGDGNTSEEIVKVLETIELGETLLKKKLVWSI